MRVAFLGPAGTHSEVAFREFLPEAEGVACFSVPEIFRVLLEGTVDAGFVPIENLIQGPVTETLDSLFAHHGKVFISDSHLAPIRNALGVLSEADCGAPWPRKVSAVYSHEQPLRQCAKKLSEKLPGAESVPCPSTAAAMHTVKQQRLPDAAVIGAAGTLAHEGFLVLEEDISDVSPNKTRFVLVQRGSVASDLPAQSAFLSRAQKENKPLNFVTSIVVDPGRDRKGLLFEILQVLSIEHRVNIVTIHSRPDTRGGVLFYFDLEGHPADHEIQACLEDLRRFCGDSTGKTAEIHVLGAYPRSAFYTLPFRTVGIIGSEGVMGKWFRKFFEGAGLEVLGADLQGGLSLEELAKRAGVILLSVPMSAAEETAAKLLAHARPGQLIVENCSIKSCVLPALLQKTPANVEVLGIHTMFAGDIASLEGENVVVTKTLRSGEKAQALEDLLYKHGAKISHRTIEEHDQVASFVQTVLQLNMVALAEVMRTSFPSLQSLDFVSTPNFRNTLTTMTRVLNQSDSLLTDLQTKNVLAKEMREKFAKTLNEMAKALNQGKTDGFLESVRASRGFFEGKR